MAALVRALAPRSTVLVIDTYEVLGLLDACVAAYAVPARLASDDAHRVRRPDGPPIAWHTTAGWQGLVAEFPLAALSEQEADQLLRLRA